MATRRHDKEEIRIYDIRNDISIQLVEISRRSTFPLCDYCKEGNYWNVTWPTGLMLARYIATRAQQAKWTGKRILVIGCGVGLEAVVLAKLKAVVSVLDHIPSALELVSRNCELNHVELAELICCCWRDARKIRNLNVYDIILGSDVLYNASAVRGLSLLLTTALKKDGVAMFADPVRSVGSSLDAFIHAMSKSGFRISSRSILSHHASTLKKVKLYTMHPPYIDQK